MTPASPLSWSGKRLAILEFRVLNLEKPLEVPEFNLLHKEERARFHSFTHSCVYSTSPLLSTYCVPTDKHRQAVWTEWQPSVPALSVSALYKVLSGVSLSLSVSLSDGSML